MHICYVDDGIPSKRKQPSKNTIPNMKTLILSCVPET